MTGQKIDITKAVEEMVCSEQVLQCWCVICSGQCDLEQDEPEILLSKLAEMWVTIRGFSYTGNLLEQYKQSIKESTKKKSL